MKSFIAHCWHIHALYEAFFLSGHGCVTRYLYKKRGEKRRGEESILACLSVAFICPIRKK